MSDGASDGWTDTGGFLGMRDSGLVMMVWMGR